MTEHSGHSTFLKKCIEKKIINNIYKPLYKSNNRKNDCPSVSKSDYQLDYLERVAILIIDGGLNPKLASLQATEELQARYGPDCVAVIQEQV